jgi:hypothetical protein
VLGRVKQALARKGVAVTAMSVSVAEMCNVEPAAEERRRRLHGCVSEMRVGGKLYALADPSQQPYREGMADRAAISVDLCSNNPTNTFPTFECGVARHSKLRYSSSADCRSARFKTMAHFLTRAAVGMDVGLNILE